MITTRSTQRSTTRLAIAPNDWVIIERVETSCKRLFARPASGPRTQQARPALPISEAATRAMMALVLGLVVIVAGPRSCASWRPLQLSRATTRPLGG